MTASLRRVAMLHMTIPTAGLGDSLSVKRPSIGVSRPRLTSSVSLLGARDRFLWSPDLCGRRRPLAGPVVAGPFELREWGRGLPRVPAPPYSIKIVAPSGGTQVLLTLDVSAPQASSCSAAGQAIHADSCR